MNGKPPALAISRDDYDAVIFDLDGVITDTASVHFTAWKHLFDEYLRSREGEAYKPFSKADYLTYVDGKPRYEGVSSFLESRGIQLAYGTPEDTPDQETVCGLGNKKNVLFQMHLKDGVKVYDSSVQLLNQLKTHGIKTAVVTSSKNCDAVLDAVKLTQAFDAKVDGVIAAELGLEGKPAPATFLEAVRRLGVDPLRSIVVEDAIAGVQAGCQGNFGCVLGIDRIGQATALKRSGADVVVSDLAEVTVINSTVSAIPNELPSALECLQAINQQIGSKKVAVFLDYDGTLTPIVERPDLAVMADAMRDAVTRLARYCTVAIVSGRDLRDVQRLVGIDSLFYAGSHGFDIAGPAGRRIEYQQDASFLPLLDAVEQILESRLAGIQGSLVERKKFSIAVHYRLVAEDKVETVENIVDEVVRGHARLKKTYGKKVFDLQPKIDWNKGKAVRWLLKALNLDRPDVLPLFIGDDITDEDAFQTLRGDGIGIVVLDSPRPSAAHYRVKDPAEVGQFFEALTPLLEEKSNTWSLVYEGFNPAEEGLREALCTLGNGYFATRGAAPETEADDIHYPGTYLAGGYNRANTEMGGRIIENEDLVNMPNWLPLSFRIGEGNWFRLMAVDILFYRQELDMREGVLRRDIRFRDKEGRQTRLKERRLVHMDNPHLAALETTLTAENWSGPIEIRSALDGQVVNAGVARYRSLNNKHLEPLESRIVDEEAIFLKVQTNQSEIRVAEAARTRLFRDGEPVVVQRHKHEEPGYIADHITLQMEQGKPITIEKVVALYTSRDWAITECGQEARKALTRTGGFDALLRNHILAWQRLGRRFNSEVELAYPERDRRAVLIGRLHLYHLLQTVSPHTAELDVGVPARGWHGEAYRGHIFWDELFIFPLLNLRIPEITRALLLYRCRRLDEARAAAREAGYRGAMYPWQSASNGREETQTVHLNPRSGRWLPDASRLQRHVNIAIAYSVWQYYEVTQDMEFLAYHGAEMMLEIARFWASIATYNEALGRYEILGVMGPDEYHEAYPGTETPGLNNNAYTNLMAVWVLCRALDVLELLSDHRRRELCQLLSLTPEELEHWRDVSYKMRVVFHDDDIISQFEGYDQLEEFDWEGYRQKYGNIQRLDRILEAEGDTPNRYKLSKQADVLMLFYVLSAEEVAKLFKRLGYAFDPDLIPKNIEYYLKRTSHGSTLSRIVHSWVLARSDRARSWAFFNQALESDISDAQGGTTKEGIHLGAMAGSIDLVQRGYTGIETQGDVLRFNPCLPDEIKQLRMRIRYRNHLLTLVISHDKLKLKSHKSQARPIKIRLQGKEHELAGGETKEFPFSPAVGAPPVDTQVIQPVEPAEGGVLSTPTPGGIRTGLHCR